MWRTVREFESLPAEEARQRFALGMDTRDWKVSLAQDDLRRTGPARERVRPIAYRPFDSRFTYYTDRSRGFLCMPRGELMPHLLAGPNYALISARSNKFPMPNHFFVSRTVVETKCGEASTQSATFPLYVYPDAATVSQVLRETWPPGQSGRRPNLDPAFVHDLEQETSLTFVTEGGGDLQARFGPEDVLAYIYAVFHWPDYRRRFATMLKLDFPRVPPPVDREQFTSFARLGHRLLSTHLLEDPDITGASIRYQIGGDNLVAKGFPKCLAPGADPTRVGRATLEAHAQRGRVFINPRQYFEGVEPEAWQFQIGGYQVAEKWLKDRRERTLTYDDITHYSRVIEALRKTIALMDEVERAGAAYIPDA